MSVSRSLFRITCFAKLFAFALTFFASSLALAYPVILNSSEITPLFGTTRSQLIALRADDQGAKRVALQIDEVEDDAALVLREPFEIRKLRGSLSHPKRNDPFAGRMQSVHRIVLDDRDFSSCTEQCSKRITESARNVCATPYANVLLKITLAENQKQVFLVDCGIQMNVFAARDVKYDSAKSKISTPIYEYIYQSDKNIFFKEIKTKNTAQPVLSNSELKAYLKPKFLFNMKFKDDDLVSQITSVSRGSQSLSLEVAVALNILAMKINNQICCDVSFFEDSLYFPVVLDLPFSGNSFAKGSGVFFGFEGDKESKVQTEFIPAKNSDASDAIVIRQEKNIIVIGMRNPNRKTTELVRPKVVSSKDMSGIKFMPVESESGIFYDIQNAKEGFQHFNVWMFFGAEEDKAKLINYAQNGPRVTVETVRPL